MRSESNQCDQDHVIVFPHLFHYNGPGIDANHDQQCGKTGEDTADLEGRPTSGGGMGSHRCMNWSFTVKLPVAFVTRIS